MTSRKSSKDMCRAKPWEGLEASHVGPEGLWELKWQERTGRVGIQSEPGSFAKILAQEKIRIPPLPVKLGTAIQYYDIRLEVTNGTSRQTLILHDLWLLCSSSVRC